MAHRRLLAFALTTALLLTVGAAPALADDPPPTDPPSTAPSDPSPSPSDPSPSPSSSAPPPTVSASPSPDPSDASQDLTGLVPCDPTYHEGLGGEGPDGYWYRQDGGGYPGWCLPAYRFPHAFFVGGGIYLRDPLVVGFGPAENSRIDVNYRGCGGCAVGETGGYVPAPLGATGHTVNGKFVYNTSGFSTSGFAQSSSDGPVVMQAPNTAPVGQPTLTWTMGDTTLQPTAHEPGTGW